MKRNYINVNEKGHLEFFGCDTVKLAGEFKTPLYVMSEDGIRQSCKQVREHFMDKYPNTLALYASKAFSNIAMCKIIKEEGLGIDVVSGGELYTACKSGFPMEKVYFHGNNKSQEEIELGIDNNVGCFVIDSFHEVKLLQKIAQKKGVVVRAILRISPGISGHTHEYISTGQLDSKFGFPIQGNVAFEAIEMVSKCENIKYSGIHCHIGSQMFNKDVYKEAVHIMTKFMLDLKNNLGLKTEELNMGGGFGIYYSNGDKPLEMSEFIEVIMGNIYGDCKKYSLETPRVLIEPGRWLVGENGITLYTIGAIKEIEGIRKYVSVDGGMADNPRPALYQAENEAIVANKADKENEDLVTIAGRCCESGDMLIHDIKLPKMETGDILAMLTTGAYNYSMSSNYNRLPRPAVVMLKAGNSRLVVKRETYEDIVRNDLD
ncbi:diaminopimelate decarboxylase [Clostridium sp. CF011]|uniref:diaminopimelate decarboxylase n=1 Tax=Clostridium sp. CF011 TaxID=2843318 RepID=UPI001C0B2549|nr:diaminopimelate decarboxylase [Clostridium sp. CF011]MBU3090492.1 diaminopimelate decarboxylase [Clostridium sp. CF011]WAG69853.1 diaminopimelate decarboxylase [Clostridium sp. CF011]